MGTSKSKIPRTLDEPAFVLHHYDWSESSLILESFTRRHGRVALVAKGVKRPASSFRPVLLPLQGLRISFGGLGEVRTLKAAEWVGGYPMPTGEALISGFYLNELLMRLLARDDPHPELFDIYAHVVEILSSAPAEATASVLRAFELCVLKEIGLLAQLSVQTLTASALIDQTAYCLVAEGGLRTASASDTSALQGSSWLALQLALDSGQPFAALLRCCAQLSHSERNALQIQLRALLHYHCGVGSLRTRQVMLDVQAFCVP